jgi:hypothetical protein
MSKILYYFDKWTAWLDFSWIITKPKKPTTDPTREPSSPPPPVYNEGPYVDIERYATAPPRYDYDPLLRL